MDAPKYQSIDNSKNDPGSCARLSCTTFPSKAAFFLLFSAVGCVDTFANVFFVSLGLTAREAGFITGSGFALSALAGPFWGLLADRSGYRQPIFLLLCVGFACSGFSWPWIAREAQLWTLNEGQNLTWNDKDAISDMLGGYSQVNICSTNNTSNINQTRSDPVPFSNPLFYSMFSISVLTYIFMLPAESFLNSIISNIIQNNPSTQGFGRQRMFGAIGIGTANLIAGFAADCFDHPTLSKYTAVYILVLPYVLLTIPLSILLFKKTKWESGEDELELEATPMLESNDRSHEGTDSEYSLLDGSQSQKISQFRILINIFRNLDNCAVILTVLIAGTTERVTVSFLYLIIKDEMNGTRTSMGLSMLVNSFSAAIMFFFTTRVIKAIGGPIISMELSLLGWIIRLLLISYIKNPWLMCLPQSLHSFTFALYWAAMVQYIEDISTKEVYITLFTLLTSVQYGAGGFFGNVIGGAVYDRYKGPALCHYTAVAVAIWLIVIVLHFHVTGFLMDKLRRIRGHYSMA